MKHIKAEKLRIRFAIVANIRAGSAKENLKVVWAKFSTFFGRFAS
jgi:hypothetical protein